MKTLKANNYVQAVKECENLDKSIVEKLKEEIKHCDRKHFHIVTIKVSDRPGEAKNKVTSETVIINPSKFEKLKKNFKFLGFAKLIVLHDPSNLSEEDEKEDEKKPVKEIKTARELELEKEIEAMRKKYESADETNGEGDKAQSESTSSESIVPDPFANGDTVNAMKEFANAHEIELSGLRNKEEIKATLMTWYNEKIEESK